MPLRGNKILHDQRSRSRPRQARRQGQIEEEGRSRTQERKARRSATKGEAMNHCELCGKRLDMSEKSERMSGLCWDCAQQNPEEFEERYAAEEETYRERPEAHQ